MSTIKIYNPNTKAWEVGGASQASSLGVLDLSGNYESDNVEGCLRELGNKLNTNNNTLSSLNSKFADHITNHPGGSGGGGTNIECKITSTFEGGVVDTDKELIIPIFFSSTNNGGGTLFLSINGIEVKMMMVAQGSVRVNIPTLINMENEIEIYIKDSKGIMSNLLYWRVVKGGIDFKLNFNFEQNYTISDTLPIRYEITTSVETPLILELTYNGKKTEHPIEKGLGQKIYRGRDLGVGIHQATLRIVSGQYKSQTHDVSLIIVSSYELFLSSTFKNTEFEYGSAIIVPYRISKDSDEYFEVKRILDGNVKTLYSQAKVDNWTIPSNDLKLGEHTIRIEVTGVNNDFQFLEFKINVVIGSYEPVNVERTGLLAWYDVQDMSNDDIDKGKWIDRSGNNVSAILQNFNFTTNGWIDIKDENGVIIDKVLRCDNDAYVEIDLNPFEENALYGLTIEVLYKANNIGYEDARVLDCTDIVGVNPDGSDLYKGAFIDVISASMRSDSQLAKVTLDEETEVRITYVLDRFEKFCKVYIDGVLCRAFYLKDTINGVNKEYENFAHNKKIYLNSEKGLSKFGACDIKVFRVYNMALSSDEVLKNHIADIKDLNLQKEKYDFNYNNKVLKTPTITMFCSKEKFNTMTGEQSIPLRVKYDSPNPDFYGESFDLKNCDVLWQGSSSLEYVLKNYTMYLKDENFSSVYYTPFKNGIPENVFCLKADYIESSHANNLGLAKFIHNCLYKEMTPAQAINPNYRTTIDGFPILLYADYMDGKEKVLLGAYNFNLDRYSTYSYGYEDNALKSNILAYEIAANSDITAGAFVEWTSNSGKGETEYYADSFKPIYPPSRKGNDNYEEIKRLVRWVSSASDEVFKDQIKEYFNLEYLLRYYLMVMIIGGVDSLGKNVKMVSYDKGRIWYPEFYDMDTALGLNNTGNLIHDSDIEVEEGIFMTTGSVLWTKVRNLFQLELREQYAEMRKNNFTVNSLMKYLYGEQVSKIPERNYNLDAQAKYLDFGPLFLNVCHGNRYHHMKKWIRERLVYVDSLLGYNGELSDTITMRINKAGNVAVWLEAYVPMYLTVKWKDLPDEIVNGQVVNRGKTTVRVGRNEKVEFKGFVDTATDQNVFIYAGRYLKSIDGLSELKVSELLFKNATKLTKLECHSEKLINTQISNMENLQFLDISGCKKYGDDLVAEGGQKTLDLTLCKYLKKINFNDTSLTSISLNINGGSVEEIIYPSSVQSIVITNQTKLKKLGIPYGYKNVIRDSEPLLGKKYEFNQGTDLQQKPNINNPTIINNSMYLTFKDPVTIIYGINYKMRMNIAGGIITVFEFNTVGDMIYTSEMNMTVNNIVDYSPQEGSHHAIFVLNSNNVWSSDEMQLFRFAEADNIDKVEEGTSLQVFNVNNCKNISQFTQYKYPLKYNSTLDSIKHVQNLSISNSLSIKDININGMSKLREAKFSGLESVLKISFNDMNTVNSPGVLGKVTISNCPKIDTIEMNVADINNAITFSNNAVMDLSNLQTLKTITSNTPVLGLTDIIINPNVTNLIFDNKYKQQWSSSIKNIWSYTTNDSNKEHGYSGLDFTDLKVKDLSLESLKYIENLKNFNISPINKFNIQGDRDGLTYPFLIVNGTIDLTNYTGSCVGLFKNIDLTNINIIRNSDFTQTDFTSMFEGATISPTFDLKSFMARMKNVVNCSKMFTNSNISEFIFPFSFSNNANISEMFSGCNFTSIGQIDIPYKVKYISGLFKNCKNLTNISGFTIHDNITDISSIFEGCTKITEDINMPLNITNAKYAFKDCVSITHINNNWDKNYTMGISATGCYSGCSSITHVNGDYILASANDTGISYIPANWGGGGMSLEITSIFNINTSKIEQGLLESLKPGEYPPQPSLTVSLLSTEKDYSYLMPSFIDWGDGTVTSDITSISQCTHTYQSHGVYTVKFNSLIYSNQSFSNTNCYGNIRDKIIEVRNIPTFQRTNGIYNKISTFRGMLANMHNLKYVNLNSLPNDKSYSADSLFSGCENENITILLNKKLKLSSVANMFNGCKNILEIDMSNYDLSECTNMQYAYNNCSKLSRIIGLSTMDTSKVISFNETFALCNSLLNLNEVTNWNISKANDIGNMFTDCFELRAIDLSAWNTINVSNMYGLFYNCINLQNINVDNWNLINLTNAWDAFSKTKITNINISTWRNTSNLTTMWSMFSSCNYLQTVDMSNLDLSKVNSIENLFYNCNSLSSVNMSGTVIGSPIIAVTRCNSVFSNCGNITSINMPTSIICSSLSSMFNGCSSIESLDLTCINTENVTDMSNLFNKCTMLKDVNISGWKTNNLNNMERMFALCTSINDTNIHGLENFNVSKVTNMSSMFRECPKIVGGSFSEKTATWDTSNLQNTFFMFAYCTSLSDASFTSNWSFNSIVKMSYMFGSCINLKELDFSNKTFNNLIRFYELQDSWHIFGECINLTTVNFENSTFSKLISFSKLFSTCTSLINVNFSNCSFELCYDYSFMLYNCAKLENVNFTNVRNITNKSITLEYTFFNCNNLSNIDFNFIKSNTNTIVNLSNTFYGCNNLITMDLFSDSSSIEVVITSNLNSTFDQVAKLISPIDVSTWNLESCTAMEATFKDSSLVIDGLSNWSVPNSVSFYSLFKNFKGVIIGDLNLSKWNPVSVEVLDYMFDSAVINSKIIINNWSLLRLSSAGYSFLNNCTSTEVIINNMEINPLISSSKMFDFKFMKNLTRLEFTNSKLNINLDYDFIYENPLLTLIDIRGTQTQDNILINIYQGSYGLILVDDNYNANTHVQNGWLLLKGTFVDYSKIVLSQSAILNVINNLKVKTSATLKLGANIYLLSNEHIQVATNKGWSVIQ